jgi:hypothetical protein
LQSCERAVPKSEGEPQPSEPSAGDSIRANFYKSVGYFGRRFNPRHNARFRCQQLSKEFHQMLSAIQTVRNRYHFAYTLVVFLNIAPLHASEITFVSNGGSSNNTCSEATPCNTLVGASQHTDSIGQITCLPGFGSREQVGSFGASIIIDCPGVLSGTLGNDSSLQLKVRNLTLNGVALLGTQSGITIMASASGAGGGILVLENCVFENFSGPAITIATRGVYGVVIRNTRISANSSGVLFKPAQGGGSIHATLDHVSITQSTGGGIKIDTTNGPVTVDITDSVISDNGGNGINALGNAGGQAIVNIKNSVIAKNGAVGVQANGANAGVLLQTTLLDQNTAGATSVVSGGNMFTYGNNSIVGSAGSGFNHTAGMQ